ncbi:MAG: hypothetical protein R2729_07690 [Bryobacteraceae bacterium]
MPTQTKGFPATFVTFAGCGHELSDLRLIRGESKEAFDAMANALADRYQPLGIVERMIVEEMIAWEWTRNSISSGRDGP